MDENGGEILRRFGKGSEDPWQERWQTILETSCNTPILELGCGEGQDARFLTGLGFAVVATDFSEEALELTRRRAPEATLKNVDLTGGLPFPHAAFRVIVASLSLHYFPWRQILEDVRRCLQPHGLQLDAGPSLLRSRKTGVGKEFLSGRGMPKRLFDRKKRGCALREGLGSSGSRRAHNVQVQRRWCGRSPPEELTAESEGRWDRAAC